MSPSDDTFFEPTTSSPKAAKRKQKRAERDAKQERRSPKPVSGRNPRQVEYLRSLRSGSQTIASGPAGTGKTYLAARHAMERLKSGCVDRVILGRVTVADPRHRLGFMPGDKNKKLGEWMVPLVEALKEGCSPKEYDEFFRSNQIEFLSFEHIRGRTFSNAIVILDEAQNCTWADLKTFLTRQGEGTQVIVAGDEDQVDIRDSGFEPLLDALDDDDDVDVDVIEFLIDDVERSECAKQWVKFFSRTKKSTSLTQ